MSISLVMAGGGSLTLLIIKRHANNDFKPTAECFQENFAKGVVVKRVTTAGWKEIRAHSILIVYTVR